MKHADDDQALTEMLARARRGWAPTSADAQRVHRAVVSGLLAPAPATVPSRPTGQTSLHGWAGRLALAGALTGAGAGVGYWAGRRAERRERAAAVVAPAVLPTPDIAPEPAPLAAPVTPPPPKPVVADARHIERHHHAAPEPAATPTPAESLAAEVRALRNVERALREKNPGLATAFLDDLDRQLPGGQMREERAALRTIARCTSGDQPFGVDLVDDFTQAFPASAYRARVEQACQRTDSAARGDSAGRR
jgi:hypothetical protein